MFPNTFQFITLHFTTLHCTAFHYISLHYVTLHYICTWTNFPIERPKSIWKFQSITLYYIALYCITLQFISIYYTMLLHEMWAHICSTIFRFQKVPGNISILPTGSDQLSDEQIQASETKSFDENRSFLHSNISSEKIFHITLWLSYCVQYWYFLSRLL